MSKCGSNVGMTHLIGYQRIFAPAINQHGSISERGNRYRLFVCTVIADLAQLAEAMPTNVQLTAISIPEPAPQQLTNPKNPRIPPLLGPTNTTEAVSFRMAGRTVKSDPVTALMETLAGDGFKDWLIIDKTAAAAAQSPRVHSFRQETRAAKDGPRLLAFDVEYRCPERRFEK